MDKKAYAVRLASWAKLISEANSSEMTRSAWCLEHGMTVRKFHYWQKKVREYLLDHPEGFPASLPQPRLTKPVTPDDQAFYEIEIPLSAPASPAVRPFPTGADLPASSPLVLEFGQFQLRISDGFRESTLSSVIRAIRNA